MLTELSKQQNVNGATVVDHLPKDQKSIQPNSTAENYIDKRRGKAEEQIQKEEDETAHAKQTKSNWDELISYRYAIF